MWVRQGDVDMILQELLKYQLLLTAAQADRWEKVWEVQLGATGTFIPTVPRCLYNHPSWLTGSWKSGSQRAHGFYTATISTALCRHLGTSTLHMDMNQLSGRSTFSFLPHLTWGLWKVLEISVMGRQEQSKGYEALISSLQKTTITKF